MTPAVTAQSWPGRSCLSSPSNGPAVTCRTVTPGAVSTVGGRAEEVARVKISTSTPDSASRRAVSTTYTFMPPASPVPGWSRGEVCTDSTAILRGTGRRRALSRRVAVLMAARTSLY